MRFLSTRAHGVIDYLMSILLFASPWLFNFNRGGEETVIPMALAVGMLIYSVLTNYEMGIIRKLPMSTHLLFDLLAGAFLAASPWIFNFKDFVYLPHLILGIAEIGVSLVTRKAPAYVRGYTGDSGTAITNRA